MYTKDFEVRYAELGHNGSVPVWTLQNYAQQVAAEDAKRLSFGWEDFSATGIGWVLIKMQFKLLKEISNIEKLTLKTWHVCSDRLKSRRDFIITDEKGEEIAKAVSWWVIIDLQKRKITRTPESLITKSETKLITSMEEISAQNPDLTGKNPVKQCEIVSRLEDIDVNGHVNNTHFTAWALEGMPADIRNSKKLENLLVNFKNEVKENEKIIVKTYSFESGAFWHFLVRESDNKEIASAYSVWK